jgi:hypothetical protein
MHSGASALAARHRQTDPKAAAWCGVGGGGGGGGGLQRCETTL